MAPWASALDRVERLYVDVASRMRGPTSLMEVCGSHTNAIRRFGLRARLPRELRLISGPGCPVCVTPCRQIDQAVAMAREAGVIVATFGDMMRVPGSVSSLERVRAEGNSVVVVSSPAEALDLARRDSKRLVVLFGIGFETTSPTVAATLVRAAEEGVRNFLVLPAFRLIPPAMAMLVECDEVGIDGFICPGHVSAIVGGEPYRSLAAVHRIPCVITGFEAADILEGVAMLLAQLAEDRAEVEIQYSRAVPPEGNPVALEYLSRVVRVTDARWRGLGEIPSSGLEFSGEFARFDAIRRIPVEVPEADDLPEGCACGDVMRGRVRPPDCPLFGNSCRPSSPHGPCMVSSEGACAVYERFGGE